MTGHKEYKKIMMMFYVFPIILFCLVNYFIFNYFSKYIYPLDTVKRRPFTLVLGAGLEQDGSPTDVLIDRVITAIKLFSDGKTGKLIFSGTAHSKSYDETESMRKFALEHGVPDKSILIDKNGTTTFNSCINLITSIKTIRIFIVTQRFHLPRSLFIARSLGLDAVGIPAENYKFSFKEIIFWSLREAISIPLNIIRLFWYKISKIKKVY